ncbi:GNAT family N-acetyltransferase [Nordella sp. HKS 07]|uniref:GNAT family N-acetyltransferase n=1 Tax=Nordella sp. HKS 07 TaxID=2712222 RepID=UPI0013E0ED31|nr:GNAT family N-acetyltransferase [Nordella sp. HKS 07]QIG51634.1 GNAT family N-acetyltransferase [Nordella sp. HKS 07]
MEPIETEGDRRIVPLAGGDIADAVKLSAEAGWNQVAADWAMMLDLGKAFGIKDDGRLVASGLALPHPPHFGWISMVLVTKTHRHRGLATALLGHLIAYLEGRDLTPMLDATPQGRAVYLRLGFHDVEPISRWRGAGGGAGSLSAEAAIGIDDIKRPDLAAFGADRSAILADLLGRPRSLALRRDDAFLLSRRGRTATQIGPIVAPTAKQAAGLLDEAIAAVDGPVLIDVPDRETILRATLAHHGFTVERGFSRMALGRREAFGDPARMRAIAGPELG